MRDKKISLKVLSLFIGFFLLAGCMKNPQPNPQKIGYAINNLNDTFQTYILDSAKSESQKNGYQLLVENAKEDLIAQQDQVNALIQNNVGALVVVPVDTSAMEPIVKAAGEAKIPLIFVNRNPYAGKEEDMPENVYYVGSEEITAGVLQMDYIGQKLNGHGGIAIAMGILGNEGTVKRTEGVETTSLKSYPNIKILAKETAEWQRDKALAIAENWLSTYGNKLSAIIANNDEMALGAVQAAKNNGRDDLLIIGVDAIPDALEAIEKKELFGTIFQDGKGQGYEAIQIVKKIQQEEKLTASVVYVPFELITQDNIKEYK